MARHPFHRNLIRSFVRDERGAFAVMFGVMAIVLIALGGAVVDFVSLQQHRNQAQLALDAAALALQPRIFESDFDEDEVQALAQAFVDERVNAGVVTANITNTVAIQEDGSLHFEAMVHVPTTFVRLVGVNDLNAFIESEATRKKLALEVVMVLDNSGSMGNEGRMTFLKRAARCATYTLFYDGVVADPLDPNTCVPAFGAQLVENVKIGLVPFTMYVNVGAGNGNAAWIDRFGTTPLSSQNFDNDDNDTTAFAGPVNRFTLYDNITNENWRGCVEARPHIQTGGANEYLDTDDTEPVAGQPNTMFVPLFAPDLPDTFGAMSASSGMNNYAPDHPAACRITGTCTWVQTKTQCSNSTTCSGTTTNTYTLSGRDKGTLSCTCPSGTWDSTKSTGTGNSKTFTFTKTCSFQYDAQNLSNKELQERLCKYTGNLSFITSQKGPNADCPQQATVPLTASPTAITTAIANMVAAGGTNIHEGTVWGFRAISPTAPFTEGAPYDEATSKILIVMTDGENTAYNLSDYCSSSAQRTLNGSCYYSAYGFPSNHTTALPRMGPAGTTNANLVTEMNTRTSQSCANAKAAGVTVYTIGLATDRVTQSTPAVVRAMLTACASTPAKAYFPDSPSELRDVFASIANELSALRLAR